MLHRIFAAASLLCTTLIAGCAADGATTDVAKLEGRPPPTFVDGSVNVDRSFSDDVRVSDDRLVIATAGHEGILSKIEVGSVIAGDRSTGMKKENRYGFLRRVTSIEKSGKETTLRTVKAELSEWIADGRIDFSSTKSLLDPKAKVTPNRVIKRSIELRANDEGEGKGAGAAAADVSGGAIKREVRLENTSLTVRAEFDGYFDVHKSGVWKAKAPTSVEFKSVLTIEPILDSDIVFDVSAESNFEDAWQGPETEIVLGAPIPVTLEFVPELKCSFAAGGNLGFTVAANIGAKGVFGFEGKVGVTDFDSPDDLSQAPSAWGGLALKQIGGKATASVRCELVALPKLMMFDAVGISGRIGPFVKLTADICALENQAGVASGVTIREQHGLTGKLAASVQIPVLDKGKDFELATFDFAVGEGEHYLLGSAETCTLPIVDSCAARADGLYCSELAADSAIVCEAGVIARGVQCAGATKCVGGTPDAIQCQ